MKIRKDDTVRVVAGKDAGKTGKVRQCLPRQERVMVEGVNMVKRHMRQRANVRQAGIIEREAPIHASNVMVVCSKCNRPVRLGYRRLEDGTRARVCRQCGEVLE